ncbi:MAG: tetratricopeptide repeat protein [Xanthomonadales bacterium]|nr:tetratricopeptide repeat protein [Xanthomonadales bacterium]
MDQAAAGATTRIVALLERGDFEAAAVEATTHRAQQPRDAELARLHGLALLQLGRPGEARDAFVAAREQAPESVAVLANLGTALLALGEAAEATSVLEQARRLAPDHPAVLNALGNARRAQGDLHGAAEAYTAATRTTPGHAGAWFNLAAVQLASGDAMRAEHTVRNALALAGGHPEGLLLLGHVLAAQRRFADAQAAFAAGARAAPADARFPYQIGLMAEEQRRPALAADCHARALALDPGLDPALGQLVFLRRQLCDWRDIEGLSMRLRARVAAGAAGISPFGFLSEPADATEQLHCARNFAQGIEAAATPLRQTRAFDHERPGGDARLRVGFASNGFGDHPTGLLTVALFEALAAGPLEIHLFATAPAGDGTIQQRLRGTADGWHDLAGLAPLEMAERIHASGVEILVDLRGWGGGGIAEALALRPAPLQVGWLAYPGTSGAPWLDYYIADRVVLPESLRGAFSEQVAWLPRCFQPSDPTRAVGQPPPRGELGLPQAGVVYACFNNSYKVNPPSFERMLAVLRVVPGSVLWLLAGPDGADQRLRDEAARRGVDAARLVFAAKRPHPEYLALYRHADLFLDTAPYGAHTTASDALFAGCPVLTIPGETFASRVAASLNHHLGLGDMNVADEAAFIEKATLLGRDADARAALRQRLDECRQSSGLFDMRAFARDFAALLQEIAVRHRAGLPPAPLPLA